MSNRAKKEDLFGKFEPVLDSVLKPLPLKGLPDKVRKGAQQPNSPTAQQPNSPTRKSRTKDVH